MSVAEAVTLIGAVSAALVSILTAVIGVYTANKTASIHTLVNGVSSKLTDASLAQGVAQGREQMMGEQASHQAGPA